jgi:CHAT domain-containing protein
VLASCNSAVAQVVGGDELLGLAAALLARGTAAVVASTAPLADDAAVELMVDLHRGLAQGRAPSEALSAARRDRWSGSGAEFAAAASVTLLGADPGV